MSNAARLGSVSGSNLPAIPLQSVEMAVASARGAVLALWSDDPAGAIARVEALDLQDLGRRLDATMRPATVKEIAVLIARYLAGYPTKNRDPEFGTILFDEVAAKRPGIGPLEVAVRDGHLNSEFASIKSLIHAVGVAVADLEYKKRELTEIPELLERARARLRQAERKGAARAACLEAWQQRDGAWYLGYLEKWLAEAESVGDIARRHYANQAVIRSMLGTPMTEDELARADEMRLARIKYWRDKNIERSQNEPSR
jgi:hypothetical protein